MLNKRGESLVEVIVALGIIAFIFMGVVNIIANTITLNTSARQRTEVVAKVQKNLNEYLAINTNNGACTINGRVTEKVLVEGGSDCDQPGALTGSTQVCYWREVTALAPNESGTDPEPNNENFIKVVSHGKWFTRVLGEQSFEISRIIRDN